MTASSTATNWAAAAELSHLKGAVQLEEDESVSHETEGATSSWLCLERLGHLLLDQVLFDSNRTSLVIEISP